MTRAEISQSIGGISTKYVYEAAAYFERSVHPISLRRIIVLAAALALLLSLCAFTFTYFSTLAGDNLILTATYAGDGIVLANIQNQSEEHFHPL